MNQNTERELKEYAEHHRRTQFWILALLIGVGIGFAINGYLNQQPSRADQEKQVEERKALEKAGNAFRKNTKIFHRVAEFVRPSVVNISTRVPKRTFWGFTRNEKSEGTGVLIDRDGHILTNYHNVKGKQPSIQVTLADDRVFQGKRIGYDSLLDLAIVKIDAENLTPAPLGDSKNVQVGEWVLAIGSPFGLNQSVTTGIVSALDRGKGRLPATKEGYIQTDASINPGNSGGPLVNLKGEVIGINTMIMSKSGGSQGVGFAIPINAARETIKRMIEEGRVEWGYLGVDVASLNRSGLPLIRRHMKEKFGAGIQSMDQLLEILKLDQATGVLVLDVTKSVPPSPAQRAGLEPFDVITSFDGTKVKSSTQLRQLILNSEPGSIIQLTILRQAREKKLTAPIGRNQ